MGSRGGAGCIQQDSSVGLEVASFSCQGNNSLESYSQCVYLWHTEHTGECQCVNRYTEMLSWLPW